MRDTHKRESPVPILGVCVDNGIGGSLIGQHGGSVVSTVASQHEGPGFESRSFQVLSVWSLHVLPVPAWVSSGYSGFPHHHKDMHVRVANDYRWKLADCYNRAYLHYIHVLFINMHCP